MNKKKKENPTDDKAVKLFIAQSTSGERDVTTETLQHYIFNGLHIHLKIRSYQMSRYLSDECTWRGDCLLSGGRGGGRFGCTCGD